MIPERPQLEGDRLKLAGLHLSELTPPSLECSGSELTSRSRRRAIRPTTGAR
jgi:hypothetical protein